jgi:hypothetical protein
MIPRRQVFAGAHLDTMLAMALLLMSLLTACSSQPASTPSGSTSSGGTSSGTPRTYTTSFPLTENPISEDGNWINGGTVGLDWTNVQTTPGLSFGTETGSNGYDDSTAVVGGSWGTNQMAQATVHTVNQNSSLYEEVELRLRTTIAAHSITGYEINFRCTSDGSQYVTIVRWNGPLGNFTYVNTLTGGPGLHDGDVVKATIVGSAITAYINGTMVIQGTDSTYTSGNPGVGFFLQPAATGVNSDYGFTNFTAMDGILESMLRLTRTADSSLRSE